MFTVVSLFISDQKNKKQQSEAMDPINALQNLTNQGTRNPMPTQMTQMMGNQMGNQMGMGNANVNPNVLQNLINVSLCELVQNICGKFSSVFTLFSNEVDKCNQCPTFAVQCQMLWQTPCLIRCKTQCPTL